MKRILPAVLLLATLQPAMAQRAYNKVAVTAEGPMYVYMSNVKGGSFDLGSNDGSADRKPAHTVKLTDYAIGTYEVTQEQWKAVMGNNPAERICAECPVTNVTWDQVQTFIERLNAATAKHYRLPTEAEWEYAARGGDNEELIRRKETLPGGVNGFFRTEGQDRVPDRERSGKKYSGRRLPQQIAWYEGNSKGKIHPIGRKQPNDLGIYDMTGNVEEWCADWYAKDYGSKNTTENPKGPISGNAHVVRGGSWISTADEMTVTRRAAYLPNTKANSLGFRLAMDK